MLSWSGWMIRSTRSRRQPVRIDQRNVLREGVCRREPRCRRVDRPVFVNKRRTSVRIEAELWFYLRQIAAEKGRTVGAVMAAVEKAKRRSSSLSSALRVYVTRYLHDHPLPVGLRGGS
jgi:predicted DNA-binding ribbon-helix-helix protein